MNKKYAKVQCTRRSLIMSILSLMLCFAMLLGTTYAWFTDSVTSGKNRIVAGSLDVELTHSNVKVTTPAKVQDSTDLFKFEKDETGAYKEVLWEPGMVVYENFTVSNVGTLALKYALSLNVFDKNTYNGKDLTEVIKVATYDGELTATTRDALLATENLSAFTPLSDFQKVGNLTAKDSSHDSDTYGVVLYWEPTDHDNDYNVNNYTGEIPTSDHQPLFVEFGITLVATQDTVESDSFDNQYDKFASFSLDFKKMTEKLAEDGTEDLTVKKTGIIEEAKIPATAANKVFDTLSAEAPAEFKGDDGKLKEGVSQELVLTLDVEKQETTGTTQKYEIDMTAVMDFIKGAEKKTVTEEVKSFEEYLTIVVNVEPGLDDVNVDHNGKNMIKLSSASEVPSTKVDNGYYFYDKTTGKLTMKTWSLSPFKVIWTNLITVTPNSTPVYGIFDANAVADFSNGKWNSRYFGSLNQIIGQIGGICAGDEVHVYLEKAKDGLLISKGATPNPDNYFKKVSDTEYTYKIIAGNFKDAGYFVFSVVDNSATPEAFAITVKINHKEAPKITTQPTSESKTVKATGENINYQWYKKSENANVTSTASGSVYAESFGDEYYKSPVKYDNSIWKLDESYQQETEVMLLVHNLKAGEVIKFTKAEKVTKATFFVDDRTEIDIPESGYSIPANGDYVICVYLSGNAICDLGNITVSSSEKLINETGAVLNTTEKGTYYCVVSDSNGNQVISNAITLQ